jgi:hypothetical protein
VDSPSPLIPFETISFALPFVNTVSPASCNLSGARHYSNEDAAQHHRVIGVFFCHSTRESKLNEETLGNYLDAILA